MTRLEFASALARDAGRLAHTAFGLSATKSKGVHDVVTEMDAKVERFIRYVRDSFYVPLASRLSMHGVLLDPMTAQIEATRWLREVANVRLHGTTHARPIDRWQAEREALQTLPHKPRVASSPPRYPSVPPQHDLRQYDHLLRAAREVRP